MVWIETLSSYMSARCMRWMDVYANGLDDQHAPTDDDLTFRPNRLADSSIHPNSSIEADNIQQRQNDQ